MACRVHSSLGLVPNSCAAARIQDAPIIAVIRRLESPQRFPLPSVSGEQEHSADSVHRQRIAYCSDCPISANPSSGIWEILVSVLRPNHSQAVGQRPGCLGHGAQRARAPHSHSFLSKMYWERAGCTRALLGSGPISIQPLREEDKETQVTVEFEKHWVEAWGV